MLKKAGIVVAVAATGLLAVTSFAFADETISKENLSSTCSFAQAGGPTTTSVPGGNAFLALVNAAVNATVPVNAQVPILDCNNVNLKDTVDLVTINPSNEENEIED